ncbi:hypothetical protein ACWDYJ_32840 [Streptomyces sp. NPDC003042]
MPWLPRVPGELFGPREGLFVYVLDESGDQGLGALIGGLRFEFRWWEGVDARWQRFCLERYADPLLDLRAGEPLHAVELTRATNRSPEQAAARREVLAAGLRAVAAMSGVTPIAFHRPAATREQLHAALIPLLNARHAADGTKGIVYFDGDGSEKQLWPPYRTLKDGRIDGPNLRTTVAMPLLQAADFVVHAAYQSLARKPGREDLWDLFPRLLPKAEGPDVL